MAMTEVFMGNSKQYTNEFRAEAVKQVVERGFTVVDEASRIGIPKHTLYGWDRPPGRWRRQPVLQRHRPTQRRFAGSRPS